MLDRAGLSEDVRIGGPSERYCVLIEVGTIFYLA